MTSGWAQETDGLLGCKVTSRVLPVDTWVLFWPNNTCNLRVGERSDSITYHESEA